MKAHMIRNIALITTGLMAAATVNASSSRGTSGQERRDGLRVQAIAALQPVGAATGWGRLKVEDRIRDNRTKRGGSSREVEVVLFDLDPMTSYTIWIDDVLVGSISTNSLGDARREFASSDDSHPPVPAELPSADRLVTAWILDPSMASALEGHFTDPGPDPGPGGITSVYQERISLDSGISRNVVGVAKVERYSDGSQLFETVANGLIPGARYRIAVDGLTAGIVTANAVGQAALKVEYPDIDSPMPAEMIPIDALRSVEWLDRYGDPVLKGSFTGRSDHDGGDDRGDDNGGGN